MISTRIPWRCADLSVRITRSLLNYLVPILQVKRAKEEEEKEDDRPG
jgi:hypothetical protein